MSWVLILVIVLFVLQEYPAVLEELDLVQEADQFTHMLTLEDAVNGEEMLSMLLAPILNVELYIFVSFSQPHLHPLITLSRS